MRLVVRKRGQATAVGAVFFILILGIVLGYMFYFINQVEDLNRIALSTIQERYEKQREKLSIIYVDYVETRLVNYNPASVELVYGTVISDSPLIIESTPVGGGGIGGGESIALVDENSAWDYSYGSYDGISCPRGICRFELKRISGYIGAEAYVNLRNVFWVWKKGDGFWSAPFNFPDDVSVSSLGLSISYRVQSLTFIASSGFVRWNFSVLIVNENNDIIYWHTLTNVTHRDVRDDYFTITLNDIPASAFVPGERYYLKVYIYVEIFLFVKITPLPGFLRIVYDGTVYFNNVQLVAYYQSGGGGGGIGEAGAVFGFNLQDGVPLSLKAELEVNDTPVELEFYYKDSEGVWRRFESYIIRSTSTVSIGASIPDEAKDSNGFMVIANADKGFKLTIYSFKLNCSYIADNLNITLANERGEAVRIVSLWIVSPSKVWRSDLNVVLAPLEERIIQINYRVERGTGYLIRVVTEKGNVFDYYISIP